MKTLNVDLDLVKKYNVAGPRYTSYPPATKFTDAVTWDQLSEKIESNNQTPRDLSVYFHIPFCETLCWFCGCTTVITLPHAPGRADVEALGREVARLQNPPSDSFVAADEAEKGMAEMSKVYDEGGRELYIGAGG